LLLRAQQRIFYRAVKRQSGLILEKLRRPEEVGKSAKIAVFHVPS
jgi:hypothetical protein